jgi:hypothetical protein
MDDTEGKSLPHSIDLFLLLAELVSILFIVIANPLDRSSRATVMLIHGHSVIAIVNSVALHTRVHVTHGNRSLVVDGSGMIICSSNNMR